MKFATKRMRHYRLTITQDTFFKSILNFVFKYLLNCVLPSTGHNARTHKRGRAFTEPKLCY